MRKYISKLPFYNSWSIITITLVLIVVFILCLFICIPRIENSLQKRSSQVLSAEGSHFNKVKVRLSGRDANLDGSVTSKDLAKLAYTLVKQVWGIRVVNSKLQVSEDCPLTIEHNQNLQAELDALSDKYPNIVFDEGKTNPSKELIDYLQGIARAIKRYEPMSIVIVSSADDSDGISVNPDLALSEARAQIVRDLLVERGLSVRCLSVFEKGKEQSPIDTQISKGHYIKFLVEEIK